MSDEKEQTNQLDSEQLGVLNTMKNVDGRHFMFRQLHKCCVFESIFDINPVQLSFNEGMREAGLNLDRLIREVTPEMYIKMLSENM